MRITVSTSFIVLSAVFVLLLAGCGGSSTPSANSSGTMSFSVKWPPRPASGMLSSREIPGMANIINIEVIQNDGDYTAFAELNYDETSQTFTNVPVGSYTVKVTAWTDPDEEVVASASTYTAEVFNNQNTAVPLVLNPNYDSITLSYFSPVTRPVSGSIYPQPTMMVSFVGDPEYYPLISTACSFTKDASSTSTAAVNVNSGVITIRYNSTTGFVKVNATAKNFTSVTTTANLTVN